MKLLDRHIIHEIQPGFWLGVVLFAGFIWIAGGPLLSAVNYLARGIPLWIVAQVIGLYLPPMLVLAFPMAMLISVIMAYTRFSSESEAVALFASGISFYRMLLPTAAFALMVTLLGLIIDNSVVPAANRRIADLKTNVIRDIQQTTEPFALPALRDANGRLQALVWVEGGYDAAKQAMRQVTINEYDPVTAQPTATVYAQSAQWLGGSTWQLQNVHIQRSGTTLTAATLETRDIRQKPETVAFLQDSPDNMTFSELSRQIAELKRTGATASTSLREAEVSLWDKIALPCASFVFALVGAPLALKPQRAASRGAALGTGVLIILAYYALFKYLDILGANGHIDPMLAAFLPNLIGAALAAWLIGRATT